MRIGTGVIGAIVLFFVARWILGFVFTLVKFGIFIALVVGAFYLYSQFTKKE